MKSAFLFCGFLLLFAGQALAQAPMSEETENCLGCHESVHPGIVQDWKASRHARTTPAEALKAPGLALKVSGKQVPENLKAVSVGCAECHTLRPGTHEDTFDHGDGKIHVVVSPADCAVCHTEETEPFGRNLMSRAHGNLNGNEVYRLLERSINGTPVVKGGRAVIEKPEADPNPESCEYCHGTRLSVRALVSRDTELGEMEFPDIAGWSRRNGEKAP